MSETSAIKVYARIKPTQRPSKLFQLKDEYNQIEFDIPKNVREGLVNNTKTSYKFKFNGLLDMSAPQDSVFDIIAKDSIADVFTGYNSTIFAYGQTGSGKTFTITGGPDRYEDRGIIPRTLSEMFRRIHESPDHKYSVYISYLEIYNNQGYDLLDPSHDTKALEELPRVSLLEDDDGNIHLKNLSMHLANDEEEALNLLFLGDTNRAISETPMNLASSRSHCIFTISLESRAAGSDVVRRSKLHLVDLAGSERVHKTHAEGRLLREASAINSSLHFLEMVIVALHERSKKKQAFVPYRNSMITSVLRDSLGGNCRTTMIATLSAELEQTDETISTCRFAQRVAMVKNSAIVNEETDPYQVIKRLKTEVAALKSEVAFLKGEAGDAELTEGDRTDLDASVEAWLREGGTSALSIGSLSLNRINYTFDAIRRLAVQFNAGGGEASGGMPGGGGGGGGGIGGTGAMQGGASSQEVNEMRDQVRQLRAQIQQRDNEIAILVNMVKQLRAGAASGASGGAPSAYAPRSSSSTSSYTSSLPPARASPSTYYHTPSTGSGTPPPSTTSAVSDPPGYAPQPASSTSFGPAAGVGSMLADAPPLSAELLQNRDEAFKEFKKRYPKTSAIEHNKRLLKETVTTIKGIAKAVEEARNNIKTLKSQLEANRQAMANAGETKDPAEDPEEQRLRELMDHNKQQYTEGYRRLQEMKGDVDRIKKMIEKGTKQMHSDFDSWYSNSLQRLGIAMTPRGGNPDLSQRPPGSSNTRGSSNGSAAGNTASYTSQASLPSAHSSATPASSYGASPYSSARPSYSASSYSSATPFYSASSHSSPAHPPAQLSRSYASASSSSMASQPPPSASSTSNPSYPRGGPPLTGNREADEDIMAFYRAREELLRRKR